MSARPRPSRLLTVLTAAALLPVAASAQYPRGLPNVPGGGGNKKVETKELRGDVESVSPRGVVLNVDGESVPVPIDRQTVLDIQGMGDTGFIQPGAGVWVEGKLKPDGSLINASFVVHPSAQQTLPARTERTFDAENPQVRFAGQIVSWEPFVVRSLDTLVPEMKNPQGGPARKGRPIRGATIPVTLEVKQPERVRVAIPPNLRAVGETDRVIAVIRSDRPTVASSLSVMKQKIESPAAAAAAADEEKANKKGGKKGGKKAKDEAKDDTNEEAATE